ncbi:MAG: hypothetical protein BroJett040_01610 [Oligoflexia bacterium]|nr:MAG: hypothetical protein BroJett040_01610 [Oligoflexia bacterium]
MNVDTTKPKIDEVDMMILIENVSSLRISGMCKIGRWFFVNSRNADKGWDMGLRTFV